MISPETIQQIVSRIDIIEILNSFIKLKKRGSNYIGLCPFHNEKTPSFTVSPSKEIYKCFGCGRSGNTITFLMEHEKYSYVESLKWLAAKYNIEIEEKEVSSEAREKIQIADSLYILNSYAQKFFSDQLHNTDEGRDIAESYLRERGFRQEIIDKFELGYNPIAKDTFAKNAGESQFNKDILIKSGLVNLRDGVMQDNYRGRIIFPIHNQSGKVQGFGARIIAANDKAPKYINTPENEIYVKSKVLYGLWQSRHTIDKHNECLLVEGYTDVVALHQGGIENVVASGGTSLTQDQLNLIKKLTTNLTILYDGDEAGIKAALRGLDIALSEGLEVKLVLLPDQEDPDSFIRKNGTTKFREFVEKNKKDFILFQMERGLKKAGEDPTLKAKLVSQIAESISRINKIEDFTRQQDYIKKTAETLDIDEAGLHNLVNKFIRDRLLQQNKNALSPNEHTTEKSTEIIELSQDEHEAMELISKSSSNEKSLVRCLLDYGIMPWEGERTVADYILYEFLEDDTIHDPMLKKIIELYKTYYENNLEPTSKSFLYIEDLSLSKVVVDLVQFPYEISEGWEERYETKVPRKDDNYINDITSTICYLQLSKIKKLITINEKELALSSKTEETNLLIQTHFHLKQLEMGLTKELGTVILK
ncbi:MAG: DNA primase [Bacteroidetes bacterium]|nr:DNA primase [Bacteroidota bacterium]